MASLDLLDTPRRASLNTCSTSLRASIKEWERAFAATHDGKKPSKSDIKANAGIAAKYKEFQKLRDVLSGKSKVETLQSPGRKQKPDPVRRRLYDLTPRKPKIALIERHPSRIDPYDAPPSASPKRFLQEIAPTPQRDGKVLGLFDWLSNSGGSRGSKNTPGSSSKKRKVDAMAEADSNIVAQTPSRKRIATSEDILQHLGSINGREPSAERRFGRTPASENKKFMLNNFFATPSAIRFANVVADVETTKVERTPLRNLVLGLGSAEKQQTQATELHDTTPVFLRRSHSFKERLVSAKPKNRFISPSAVRKGPSILRQYRSALKPPSHIVRDLQNATTQESPAGKDDDYNDEDDDDDDAMEAMRETETNVQLQQTQLQELSDFEGQGESDLDDGKLAPEKEKVWKKKGQKRTTRKSNMKPALMKQAKAPKFVAAEESDDETSRVEKTPSHSNTDIAASSPYGGFSDDELQDLGIDVANELRQGQQNAEGDFQPAVEEDPKGPEKLLGPPKKRRKAKSSEDQDEPHAFKPKKSSRAATINPNAISHQNFKTLKIRGKAPKPTGAAWAAVNLPQDLSQRVAYLEMFAPLLSPRHRHHHNPRLCLTRPPHNFTVDRTFISAASPYFRKHLEPESSVGQFNHPDLVDQNPEAFTLVSDCLTFEAAKPLTTDPERLPAGRLSKTAVDVPAYILALKLGMDGICNQIMDQILHQSDVTGVYTGALDEKMISSFPDCKGWSAVFGWVSAKVRVHREVRVSGSLDKSAEPRMMGHCYWHVHEDGEGQVLSWPEGSICAKCEEEKGELDSEMLAQAAEREEQLAAEREIRNADVLAKYVEALGLNDATAGNSDTAASTAQEEYILSASDFGDFEGSLNQELGDGNENELFQEVLERKSQNGTWSEILRARRHIPRNTAQCCSARSLILAAWRVTVHKS